MRKTPKIKQSYNIFQAVQNVPHQIFDENEMKIESILDINSEKDNEKGGGGMDSEWHFTS